MKPPAMLLFCLFAGGMMLPAMFARSADIDPVNLLLEAHKAERKLNADTGEVEQTQVLWLPQEYYALLFGEDPTVSGDVLDMILDTLRPYTTVCVVNHSEDMEGEFTFRSRDWVRANTRLLDMEGRSHAPLTDYEIGDDMKQTVTALEAELPHMLGEFGRGAHLILFPTEKDGQRLIPAATEDGRFSIRVGDTEFEYRLPLDALLPPKPCPECGEQGKGSWNYCPWCGTSLEMHNPVSSHDPEWSPVEAPVTPPGRRGHAMAYDPKNGRVILFGGMRGEMRARDPALVEALDDTWELLIRDRVDSNGQPTGDWRRLRVRGPSPRSAHSMAYDSKRGRILLFGGGGNKAELFGDTWEWDAGEWSRIAQLGPSRRSGHSMAYDTARDRVVLFGGLTYHGELGDTWEWDGERWRQVSNEGPTPRRGAGMAYDSARGKVVMFGGWDGSSALGDTWEWDGIQWQRVASSGPRARELPTMAFDSERGRVVLFGGVGLTWLFMPTWLNDTWEWDGEDWAVVSASAPPARNAHSMVYDTDRLGMILFGGTDENFAMQDDTWLRLSRAPD